MRNFGRLWTLPHAAMVVILLIVSLFAQPARGQVFGGMGMDDFTPDLVTKRGVLGYAKILGLDEEQKQTVLALLDGTKTEYRKEMKTFQDKMKSLQGKAMEDQDWTVWQKDLPDMIEKLQKTTERLETQFFDDLKAICSEGQASRWEGVERFRRREKYLRFSMVSGAGADLVAIVEKCGAAPAGNAEFVETLSQYELDIDKPVREFDRIQKEQEKNAREGMEKWTKDPEKAMEEMNKMMERMTEIGKDLRNLNRDYVRRLSPLMGEAERAKFEDEFNRRSFPRVYREAHATKMITSALALPDLSEDQRQQLAVIKEQYTRDSASANERWAKVIEEEEEKNNGSMGRMMRMGWGQGGNEDEKEARTARRELDEKTEDKVKAILTEAQLTRMPEKKIDTRQPWEDMMPDRADWVDEDLVETGK
ncbi:hypothetical protein PHYC_03084 [Phycisphaerales bacterium]|nr:hypothetical protein PHYC_03084 [Phycisphaerales bacterium]